MSALEVVCKEKSRSFSDTWRGYEDEIRSQLILVLHTEATMADTTHQLWRAVRVSSFCVSCLVGSGFLVLKCNHSMCKRCIWNRARRYIYGSRCHLEHCPACDSFVNLTVRLSPPTAGIRALSLDGGGVRGMVMLKVLQIITANMQMDMDAFQWFDFITGTSTGEFFILF